MRKAAAQFRRIVTGGGVTHSIHTSGPSVAEIYVPINSAAGEYAKRMHDEKGQTWNNYGRGTLAKGSDAGEKYIKRAITHNDSLIRRSLLDGMVAAIKARTLGPWAAAMNRIALKVHGTAKRFAPRSPSKAQYKQDLKTAAGRKRSKAQLRPGGLENSIAHQVY